MRETVRDAGIAAQIWSTLRSFRNEPPCLLMIAFAPSRLLILLLALVLVGVAGSASAATKTRVNTKLLGTFDDWQAYSYEESGQKVCFISAKPNKKEPKNKPRGDSYVLITHRPAEKSFSVVSVTAGYTYKKGSEALLKIGHRSFKLFTNGDTAWASNESTDKEISAAIRGGQTMVIKGTSERGTETTDSYKLSGTGDAFSAINKACGKK